MVFLGQYFGTLLRPWPAGHLAEGSREVTGGRDALGHRPHGAGMLSGMVPPWPGLPWVQEPEAGLCLAARDRREGSRWE